MQAFRDATARRIWTDVQSRVGALQRVPQGPSMGDVFRAGFMHGSMLQLAVCTPSPSDGCKLGATTPVLIADIGKARQLDSAPVAAG